MLIARFEPLEFHINFFMNILKNSIMLITRLKVKKTFTDTYETLQTKGDDILSIFFPAKNRFDIRGLVKIDDYFKENIYFLSHERQDV